MKTINGTIHCTWTRPIVQPSGTEFQIIRSTNSVDASVGTVVWQGNAYNVPLVMPTSRHAYYVRAVANSAFSPYQPNTSGIIARALPEADNTLSRQLVSDPELQHSSVMGDYWATNRTDIFSLSLTGGQIDGHIRTIANSSNGASVVLWAVPTSPYPRNVVGRQIRAAVRFRTLSVIGSLGIAYNHTLGIYGWTGTGSPTFANSVVFGGGTSMQIRVNSPVTAAVIPQNVYQDFTSIMTLGTPIHGDPTSYPFLVVGLHVYPAGNPASFANSGDLFEFDMVYAGLM